MNVSEETKALTPQQFLERFGRFWVVRFEDGSQTTFDIQSLMAIPKGSSEQQLREHCQLVAYFGMLLSEIEERLAKATKERKAHEASVADASRVEMSEQGVKVTDKGVEARVRSDAGVSWMADLEAKYQAMKDRVERIFWTLKERKSILEKFYDREQAELLSNVRLKSG